MMLPLAAMHRDLSQPPLRSLSLVDSLRSTRTDDGLTIRQRVLNGMARWLESGRNPAFLPQDWEYLVQSCWVFDHGEEQELPAETHEYILAAGEACGPEKYDLLLQEQGWCGVCGESFLFEHLAICADCFATRCRSCMESHDSRLHPLAKCSCGGDFVG